MIAILYLNEPKIDCEKLVPKQCVQQVHHWICSEHEMDLLIKRLQDAKVNISGLVLKKVGMRIDVRWKRCHYIDSSRG